MYKISRIPSVFTINMTTNQTGWLSLADFHIAKAFQTRDQRRTNSRRAIGIPKSMDNCVNMSAMIYLGI